MVQHYAHFIDGRRVKGQGTIESVDPWTNQVWATFPQGTPEDIDPACQAAAKAFGPWAALHPAERAGFLLCLADLIEEHAEHLASIEVKDNGKLYNEMLLQVKGLPKHYRYFAGLADKVLGHVVPVDKPEHFAYTLKEPLGVVAAIIPWNSPLLITTWKMAPALAAGNTLVIKPSEFTSASAFELATLIEKAGFPPGVVNIVSGYGKDIGPALIEHPCVAKVSLTGGTETGKRVYALAAKGIKPVTLELGGKSPNIIFEDAHLDSAVGGAISGIFAASGQTCIAGSRLLVQKSVHDEVVDKLVKIASQAKMGDPMDVNTQVGPVTTPAQHQKIQDYMRIATEEGAECVLGGKAVECDKSPWFVMPSVYTNVTNDMRIAQEEVFGPILSVIPFEDEQEAITIANDSPYGLAAGIWTQDIGRVHRVPKAIQAGVVWVNTYRAFSYLMPFGGYKQSGLGKEAGHSAINSYLQEKSVWVNLGDSPSNPFVMR